jgi:tetratricopeptide (TPR) repeat protein
MSAGGPEVRPGGRSASAKDPEAAQDLLEAAQKLEQQLKILLKTKNEADESVFAMRRNIRELYKKILYKDQMFSVANDIVQNLWKTVFYKQIEELRKLLKVCAIDPKAANNAKQAKANVEKYRRVQKLFRSFLRDASSFYEGLLDGHLKISQIVRDGSEFRDDLQNGVEDRSRLYLALLTCHRCLIFLGDLERYHQHVNDTRNYSKAERYYRQALELLPENGNPHNQLAVVSTYTNNNLAAVHRYFRSLAVTGQPFATALQNLRIIFEKNHAKVLKYKQRDLESGVTPNYDTYIGDLRRVDTFIVKLYGILYTSTDLELFVSVEKAVVKKLDALFFRRMRQSVRRFSDVEKHRFANFAMQVLTGCIFLVHNTCNPVEERVKVFQDARRTRSEGSDAADDSGELPGCEVNPSVGFRASMTPAQRMGHAYACILVFDFMWLVLRSVDKETLTLISVVAIFCDWLKLYPHILNPDIAHLSETEIASRRNLWASFVALYHQLILLKDMETPIEGNPILEEEIELGGFSFVREAYPQAKCDFSSVRRGVCAAPLRRTNSDGKNKMDRRSQQLLRCRKVINFIHFARDLGVVSLELPPTNLLEKDSGWEVSDTPDSIRPTRDPQLGSPQSCAKQPEKSDVVEWILTPSTPPVRNDTGGIGTSQRKAGKQGKLGKSKIPREEADSAEWSRGPCQPTRTLLTRAKLESVTDEVTVDLALALGKQSIIRTARAKRYKEICLTSTCAKVELCLAMRPAMMRKGWEVSTRVSRRVLPSGLLLRNIWSRESLPQMSGFQVRGSTLLHLPSRCLSSLRSMCTRRSPLMSTWVWE